MNPARLEERLAALPAGPGVYLMKDEAGGVIYVGKALNLRNRVRSYFNRDGDGRAFIPLLESLLGDIETVVVNNEKEALLLENELIKKHQPRFNIRLKDDKNFLCLRVDLGQTYPRLETVRRIQKDGAVYFGPYSSAGALRETLRIINRYFQLRTCSDHVLANRKRPCLLHQIGRCPAPCVFEIPKEEYHRSVQEVLLFLQGRAGELVQGLKERILQASKALKFEEAARVRDQLFAIERSLERQTVAVIDPIDQDVFGFYRQADRLVLYALYIRRGRISGGQAFPFGGQEFPDAELLASFVNLYYAQETFIPQEVLLPFEPEGLEGLAELLCERKGERDRVFVPKRGEKLDLVQMSQKNAEQAFLDRKRTRDETDAILERLRDKLSLSRRPARMECYDISHFQSASIVASQVVATDGEPDKARYRRFRIKSVQTQDDFASMYEVVGRRLARGVRENDLPDLIVIDGGKGQLAAAQAAMRDAGVTSVDLVSLAKSRDLEGGSGAAVDRARPGVKSPERVFLPGRKDPIVLPQSSPELFMLTRLRDEAHRFAITYQQKLMRRRNFQSVLEDVPGVGETRKKALLRHFGSLKQVREASIGQLGEVVGPAVAERIHDHLHAAEEGDEDDAVRGASLEDAGQDAVISVEKMSLS
ncbi:MAG TPA: excinuclease ABC subunit UvrC [Myxococcaceae bacterium]|nr:excinuclease ABC subunit UvrC [Myxococcaceae bacterium]